MLKASMNAFISSLASSLAFSMSVDTATCPIGVPCASLAPVQLEGATVINSTATELRNQTGIGYEDGVDVCAFEMYIRHDGANDAVRIVTWLPQGSPTPWNGRFQGTGGGGYNGGFFEASLGPATFQGFAASSTDGGAPSGDVPELWADDTQLVLNMGYLSFHDMTIVGKAVTHQFYGRPAKYSYWTGCSMGGRQAYSEAQKYPDDYNGILSVSGPVGWDKVGVAVLWPYIVQNNGADGFVGLCKLDYLTEQSVAACAPLDGDKDNVIAYPPACDFTAASQVGTTVACENGIASTVTEYDAAMWDSMRRGPRTKDGDFLWWGMEPGASLDLWAAEPRDLISIVSAWIRDFLIKDTDYDIADIGLDQYTSLFAEAVAEYSDTWGSDDPDLSSFKERGGKFLAWHGWADERIPGMGSVHYWEMVKRALGGLQEVDAVYRLFMAPGALHCGIHFGADPTDVNVLVDWVENGVEPETLPPSIDRTFVKTCKHPKKAEYKGKGSLDDPDSWACVEV